MAVSLPRKELFQIPEGVIYLDGNSLGMLPKTVSDHVAKVTEEEWGTQLIRGWNNAGWMAQPGRIGDMVGALIGAPKGSVMIGDTLTLKVFQALSAGVKMRPDRKIILSDSGNFPADLYMAEGLIKSLDRGHELKIVAPDQVADAIDERVAVVMLTHVGYSSGRMHDMEEITRRAHAAGAVMQWDLAHTAGAMEIDIAGSGAEFAVGCTYKYLNGGPGAPAFIYVRPDLADEIDPTLAGWLGHDQPFAFEQGYRPAPSIGRMRVGTPPVLQMAALEEALSVWEGVSMTDIRRASVYLTDLFVTEVERRCPQLVLASPRDAQKRGSQVSFTHENGYAIMQALIDRGVIGDFRAPDIMRFGFTPLYIDEDDVVQAVDVMAEILVHELWNKPEYLVRKAVT